MGYMLKVISKSDVEKFVGNRKHVSQMSDAEINGLFERLKSVEANGKQWNISKHALDRISEKGINATYEDVVSSIHNSTIVEYKIDQAKFGNTPDERVVIRAKSIVNRSYNLNVVYSLTNRKVITVWVNHIKDRHSTLDWSIYNKDMVVFGV